MIKSILQDSIQGMLLDNVCFSDSSLTITTHQLSFQEAPKCSCISLYRGAGHQKQDWILIQPTPSALTMAETPL